MYRPQLSKYGLYMYHEMVLWAQRRIDFHTDWFANKEQLLAIGAFLTVVGLAAVSYYAYERPFLRLKQAWTKVPSRPV